MTIAEMKAWVFGFQVTSPLFNGVAQFSRPLTFSNVKNIMIKEGSYSPANDYHYLWSGIAEDQAPNFIFMSANGMFNMTIGAANAVLINASPANKMFLHLLPPSTPNNIQYLFLEGRTTAVHVMPQGTNIDYVCVMGQATF